ncbi:MAG: SpoIIE family protein phosphatase [Betaproteobacteria bacterium]|nr:SpoIIE family protein phosphatase [Betaproteobacteria bacterium]
MVQDRAAASAAAGLAAARIERFAGALTSVDAVDRVARGWGLVSADPVGGVIRRVPLVAEIDGTLIGALTIEMFRVAAGAPSLRLVLSGPTVEGIAVGRALVPTEADGGARVYFSRRHAGRFVSAVDVLEDRVDPERLRQKLVLVAVTGLGLGEVHATPVGERMPGSEIHAQLLENLYEGTLLARPSWGPALEAALFALLAALLIVATPVWAPRHALWMAVGGVAALLVSGYVTFRTQRLLLDAATPSLALLLVFGTLLVATLTEATRHRRSLEQVLQRQREHSARIAGELDAARRVQTAMLPRAERLGPDRRLDLAAAMLPAREVGGDLYDFFRLDEQRLFFLVGDVAGKGLSASIFMAVSKALYKSATLRMDTPDPGTLMAAANAEVSRDNPEALFVTAFAAILDLDAGTLAYCNAGHENPFRVDPVGAAVSRITDGDGPPLCAVDAFAYRGARLQLEPGELLCVVSDGVTEARNPGGDLYGSARLVARLHRREAPCTAPPRPGRSSRRCSPTWRTSRPASSRPMTSPCWRCAGRVPLRVRRPARLANERPRHRRAVQRTTISTRRLSGSATPSAVGTIGSRLPRPTATMLSAATPRCVNTAWTVSARLRASASFTASLPTRSVCPITTMSGTG